MGSRLRRVFVTQRNRFGIFRSYFAESLPSHDPEAETSLDDLSDAPEPDPSSTKEPQFFPYPNANAFRLGDWYWNHGVQKSQKSFKDLIGIVGAPGFSSEDVRDVKWDQINNELADEDVNEWLDVDAGWTNTPVTIPIPFHPRRGIPPTDDDGPRDYIVSHFYHRKLMSIIRDKLSRPSGIRHFHFEPYVLHWQPGDHLESTRVHGELYTSPAFIEAHHALQTSPPEPDCDLPRIIVALMFWSDTTHLTNFGNAKICPLYMYFGNESKYRRCKPSCSPCEHVAYFEKVCSHKSVNYIR